MKYLLFICLIFPLNLYSQTNNFKYFLDNTKQFYNSNENFNYKVLRISKTSIAESYDTSIINYFVNKNKDSIQLINIINDSIKVFRVNKKRYFFDIKKKKVYIDKPKEYNEYYSQVMKNYPFWEPNNFFAALENESSGANFIFNKLDSFKNKLTINKPFYYTKEIIYTNNFEFSEYKIIRYSSDGIDINKYTIEKNENFLNNNKVLSDFYTLKEVINEKGATLENQAKSATSILGNKVEISVLKSFINKSKDTTTIQNQYILIDFFHQHCMPCIKAFPELKLLTQENQNLLILGVDPIKSDSIGMNKFIERYSLNYKILVGENASLLSKYLFEDIIFAYPTLILINPLGKIEMVHEGYTPKSIKNIRSLLK